MVLVVGEINVCPLLVKYWLTVHMYIRRRTVFLAVLCEKEKMATNVQSKAHSDRERWICIYPAYINSKKTLAQGRRINKDKAVENPTHQEIRDVLVAAGMKVGVENKLYSREPSKELLFRGRIRVQLKNDDGSPCDPTYPTRDSLLLYLGETIPKLKTRANKPSGSDQSHQQASTGAKKKGKKR